MRCCPRAPKSLRCLPLTERLEVATGLERTRGDSNLTAAAHELGEGLRRCVVLGSTGKKWLQRASPAVDRHWAPNSLHPGWWLRPHVADTHSATPGHTRGGGGQTALPLASYSRDQLESRMMNPAVWILSRKHPETSVKLGGTPNSPHSPSFNYLSPIWVAQQVSAGPLPYSTRSCYLSAGAPLLL